MLDVRATVIAVDEHPLPYFTLRLAVPGDFPAVEPGQFVMVQIGDRLEPYLRRAFSVYDLAAAPSLELPGAACADAGARGSSTGARAAAEMRLLGKVVGRGTRLLGAARPGDELRVLGPLGRGFSRRPARRTALVAGGVGSAALLLLARRLAAEGPFDLFYGGRSRLDLPDLDRFAELARVAGGEVVATTEDGSAGRRGLVTEPLAERLAAGSYDRLCACGPMGLLARLAELCADHGVPGEAALETAMGCGYGACLGCAVPHVEGRYALCCRDGPVFAFDEVAW